MNNSDILQHMCQEAIEELTSGDKGWKQIEPNTLILACFGLLFNHLAHKITKPLWFFVGCIFTGIIGYFIMIFFGRV